MPDFKLKFIFNHRNQLTQIKGAERVIQWRVPILHGMASTIETDRLDDLCIGAVV